MPKNNNLGSTKHDKGNEELGQCFTYSGISMSYHGVHAQLQDILHISKMLEKKLFSFTYIVSLQMLIGENAHATSNFGNTKI